MRVFSYVFLMTFVYLMFFISVKNDFGVIEVVEPLRSKVSGASITIPDETEISILKKVNEIRRSNGITELKTNLELSHVASQRANDMIINNYYSHINKAGLDYSSLLAVNKGFSCENLDLSSSNNPQVIVLDWMNSKSGHKECLLDSRVFEVGVSVQEYKFIGNKDNPTYIAVIILSK
jgi:uncharacterized protein YkwD